MSSSDHNIHKVPKSSSPDVRLEDTSVDRYIGSQEDDSPPLPPPLDGEAGFFIPEASEERSNQTPAQTAEADNAAAVTIAAEAAAAAASAADSDASSDKDGEKGSKKKKNRCHNCRKKVGLTGFQCRCGNLFCGVHRYSDKHDCSFNYREMGAQEIRRNNPVVVGEKIQKI